MEIISNILYYIVPFVVLLGVLVFVHELGHFLVARALGVKVDEFSLGFGKELWGRNDKKGTRWKVCAVPLGGYCKFFGDEDASSVSESEKLNSLSDEEKKHIFQLMPPSRRILIALAGPAANYLFAILVFAAIFWSFGKMTFPPVVGEVISGGAAEKAGILKDDRILEINGKKIKDFNDIRYEVDLAVDGKVEVVVQRGDAVKTLNFALEKIDASEGENSENVRPMLGIKSVNVVELGQEPLSLAEAVRDASVETWDITVATLRGVGQMLTGKRGGEDVGGIIRIAELSGDISKQSGWIDFVVFMALLSINLGLINLFPIPLLDGGHIVICFLEMVARRELSPSFKEALFRSGFVLIMALMIYATWNDVARLINRWFA